MQLETPKAALVTGAGRRIGRAIALRLAADGWAVAVHYRSARTEAEMLAGEIDAFGGRAVALAADLTRESEVAELVARAAADLEFEEAARLRDEIRRLEQLDLGLPGAEDTGPRPAGRSMAGRAGTSAKALAKAKARARQRRRH